MASLRTILLLSIAVSTFVSAGPTLSAQETYPGDQSLPPDTNRFRWDVGVEAYLPTDDNRRINTFNVNASAGIALWRSAGVWLYGGLTASFAWGEAIKSETNAADTILEISTAGLGPFLMIRWTPLTFDRVALSLNAGEGVIFYSGNFPSGGDVYNFMGRLGADFTARIDRSLRLSLGFRWMHVSNVEGLGTFNPSYSGIGGAASLAGSW